MAWYTSSDNAINISNIPVTWQNQIISGEDAVANTLAKAIISEVDRSQRPYFFALDGFKGARLRPILESLSAKVKETDIEVSLFNINDCFYSKEIINEIVRSYEMPGDPSFGRVFQGRLEDLIDSQQIYELSARWKSIRNTGGRHVVICHGVGAAIEPWRHMFDGVAYCDLTREQLIVRCEQNEVPAVGEDIPSGFPWKRIYYVEYPVLNRHKRQLLKTMDWYIDDSRDHEPRIFSSDIYHAIITELSGRPISFKVFYMPGVFGGFEFQKRFKVENLPNTSWDYEISVADNHLLVDIGGGRVLNLPFYNLFWEQPLRVLGSYSCSAYPNHFPLAIYMQDGYFPPGDNAEFKRTHMPIHLHPDTVYNRIHFAEPLGRYETYYIVRADEGACTMHGFKDDADIDKFVEEVRDAAKTGVEFDWRQYIYEHPSKTGELHQLPPGTVHGTGGRQIILEIDTQPSRDSTEYSFFLYDYHRTNFNYETNDVSAKPMKLHLDHGLAVMRRNRRQKLMSQKCRPQPRCIRQGPDWSERSFPMYYTMPYQINRLEFQTRIEDDTQDMFHCITLTVGHKVRVASMETPSNEFILEDCDTIVLPACFGPYVFENLGEGHCEIIKTFLITEPRDHIDKELEEKDTSHF